MRDAVELTDALRRSRAWLGTAGAHPSASLRHALQSLFGVWVCTRALGDDAPAELRPLLDAALEKLDDELEAGSFDPYGYDPKLLLVCLRIFERERTQPAALRTFADSIAEALGSLAQIPAGHAGVAAMLYQLGYPGIRAAAIVPAADEPDLDSLLRGGPDVVRAACSSVAAASHFGAQRIEAPWPQFEGLRRALPVVFLQSLRSYDLDTAAMLLRTSRYLRMRRSGRIEEGISFLVDHQKHDGRFGFFAVEASALEQSEELPGFDEVLTLYLPVTSTCAWALAEQLSDRCLLFERPRGRPRRRAGSVPPLPSYAS